MEKKTILGLDHFGRGIVKEVPLIFVDNALPGEEVEIKITKSKKKYQSAEVVKYLKQSPVRTQPLCPYYLECGGCDIMHMKYDQQLEFKVNKIKEIFYKFGLKEININSIIPTEQYNYRNKVTLQCEDSVGYYKKQSYNLVLIDHCLIANKKINDLILKLKNIDLTNVEQVIIRGTAEIMLIFKTTDKINKDSIIEAFGDVTSIYENDKLIYGKENIVEKIESFNFIISPTSFFQVNNDGMIKLYDKILEISSLTKQDKVLDLYCGTGTIGLYLSRYCNSVLGVEINPDAISAAFLNKQMNNINNIDFKVGDVNKVIKQVDFNPSVIIVDPPRAGLDQTTITKIIDMKPKRLIYVSCDPITLARDLVDLSKHFDIAEVTAIDMFPNTHHVETVCLLSKFRIDHHIEVNLNMEELDVASVESKATYDRIKERENYNHSKKEDAKVPRCPANKERIIVAALKHFNMID